MKKITFYLFLSALIASATILIAGCKKKITISIIKRQISQIPYSYSPINHGSYFFMDMIQPG